MNKKLLPLAAGIVAISTSAFAADLGYEPAPAAPPEPEVWVGGFYVSLQGGGLWIPPVGTSFNDGADVGETSTNTGYRVGGSIGYDFNQTFGVEAEVSYGSVSLDTFTYDGGGGGSVTGDASTLGIFGNLIVGQQMGAFRPYLGVGAGAAEVNLAVPAGVFGVDGAHDSSWAWAAQAFAGVDFALTHNVSLGARYRFQYVGATDHEDDGGTPIAIDGFGSHSLEAVLKVRFGG